MTTEEKEEIYQFLAGHWYDRPEDDDAIVREIVTEETPEYITTSIHLLRKFLAVDESAEDKASLVRRSAWRYFPKGAEAPILWFSRIVTSLEQAYSDSSQEG